MNNELPLYLSIAALSISLLTAIYCMVVLRTVTKKIRFETLRRAIDLWRPPDFDADGCAWGSRKPAQKEDT